MQSANEPKSGTAMILVGSPMIVLQLLAIWGAYLFSDNLWSWDNFMQGPAWWYDALYILSYLSIGIIGIIFLIVGLIRNHKKREHDSAMGNPSKVHINIFGALSYASCLAFLFLLLFGFEAVALIFCCVFLVLTYFYLRTSEGKRATRPAVPKDARPPHYQ